jgi:uncharacterized protein YfdQ (DUF2303 family)
MAEDKALQGIDGGAVREVAALVRKIGQPVTSESVHAVIVPNDAKLESLFNFQFPDGRRPERIKGVVALRNAVSFIRYVEAFRDDRTRIFAEPKTLTFQAILDYHGASSERAVEFLSHRATFGMEKDERFVLWASKSEKPFNQVEFAEFVEDNAADIHDPSAAHMLEVARDLHATSEFNFDSKVKLTNGQVQIKYTESIQAGVGTGNLEIPETFTIRVPVFYGEELVSIRARLRYRVQGGKLSFHFKLYRQADILSEAFDKAVAAIGESLKADVLLGGPV